MAPYLPIVSFIWRHKNRKRREWKQSNEVRPYAAESNEKNNEQMYFQQQEEEEDVEKAVYDYSKLCMCSLYVVRCLEFIFTA